MNFFHLQSIIQKILKVTVLIFSFLVATTYLWNNGTSILSGITDKEKFTVYARNSSHVKNNKETVSEIKTERSRRLDRITSDIGKFVLSQDINSFKVYIYDLPDIFTVDLIHGAEDFKFNAMCFDLQHNDGKGGVVMTTPLFTISHTHQFSSEVNFHLSLLKKLKMLTTNPEEADLFYVPYYAGLRCFMKSQEDDRPLKLNNEFRNYMERSVTYSSLKQRPHLMALGKVEQEMSSNDCPILRGDLPTNMKFFLIEQTVKDKRKFFKRAGKEEQVIVIPYPSYVHYSSPNSAWDIIGNHNISTRDISVLMIGSYKKNNLRKSLGAQLRNCSICHFELISTSECSSELPQKATSLMLRSKFCLQPPGDTPTRKSFIDGLLLGCIPVIFRDDVVYPYMDYFNYSTFSVYVPEDEIVSGKVNIVDVLANISKDDIHQMQLNIGTIAKYFQYGNYDDGEDLVTLSIRNTLHRFKMLGQVNN